MPTAAAGQLPWQLRLATYNLNQPSAPAAADAVAGPLSLVLLVLYTLMVVIVLGEAGLP